ncbi:hypothetical protein SAMD00023353_5200110 [Rosellinia necatrix]|uniref:Uncharacterized protein n=1 Tax=Rosellinia necatrix TaxID=77044 RepID=A0A1W2TQG5_ROSNE|nr:hypothetical protein SAMD00023353_5200110 [Rosellinia necatrix]
MGNASSTSSALHTHTTNHTTLSPTENHRSLSITPFDASTLVSITRTYSRSSSHGPSIQTDEFCSWDWEVLTSTCTTSTFTVDVPTPVSTPTRTRAYETSEASYSFPFYTCTDFLCIDSVVSDYGYSLCIPTSTSSYESLTETWRLTEKYSTDVWVTVTPTCDPVFGWKYCSSLTSESTGVITDAWPTDSWSTDDEPPTGRPTTTRISPADTSPNCDSSTASDSSTDDFTEPWTSRSVTTKHSYSYHGSSTRQASTSTTSECDFWDDDCTPTVTGRYTSQKWEPTTWSRDPIVTTVRHPRQSAGASE